MTKYRVLVGSFQQADENGQVQEFSRDDQVWLTDEAAAAAGDAVEPWSVAAVTQVVTADRTDTEVEAELRAQLAAAGEAIRELGDMADESIADLQKRIAELEAAAAALNEQLAARDARIAELEAATPAAEPKKK